MTPLSKIAWMNFDELSRFVNKASNGTHYVAKPAEANQIDYDICAEAIINIVIIPALKNAHARKDSRSLKIGESDHQTALQLASAARTYWVDRGFIISTNARVKRAISAKIKDEEMKERKADLLDLQLEKIGCIVGAKRACKKDAIQGFFDFEESELQIARISNESEMPGSYHTLEAIA